MIERKYWAEGHRVEHSAKIFLAECSTPFPLSGFFSCNRTLCKRKEVARIFIFHMRVVLQKRFHPCGFWIDRTFNAQFDHWGQFRRTLSAITIVLAESGK